MNKSKTAVDAKLTKKIVRLLKEHELPVEHAKDVAEIINDSDLLAPQKYALSLGVLLGDYKPGKKAAKGDALWEDIESMLLDSLPAGELLGQTFEDYYEWDDGSNNISKELLPKQSAVAKDIAEIVQKLAKFDSDAIEIFKQYDIDAVQKLIGLSCLKKADSIIGLSYLVHLLGIILEEVSYDDDIINEDSEEYEPTNPADIINSKSLKNWLNADTGIQAMHWLHSWLHGSDWQIGEDDFDDYLIMLQSEQDELVKRMTFVAEHFDGTLTPSQFMKIAEGILADADVLIGAPSSQQEALNNLNEPAPLDEHALKVKISIFTTILMPLIWHGVFKQQSGRLALPQPNDKLKLNTSALQALRLAQQS